jgi:hypothetical protein
VGEWQIGEGHRKWERVKEGEKKRWNRSRRNDLIREVEILISIIGSATGHDPDH